jgi:hypothetical protein
MDVRIPYRGVEETLAYGKFSIDFLEGFAPHPARNRKLIIRLFGQDGCGTPNSCGCWPCEGEGNQSREGGKDSDPHGGFLQKCLR